MQIKKQPPVTSSVGIRHAVIVAVVYFIGVYLMRSWQISDEIELRIATFIPVAMGLLWGAPAAIGSGLADFVCEIYDGADVSMSLIGGLSNFFLAYLPYRLWYAVSPQKASLFIYDSRSFRKYIFILSVVAFNFTAIIATMKAWKYGLQPLENYFITFSNNFDIPVILGIPLLLYLRSRMNTVYCNIGETEEKTDDKALDSMELNDVSSRLIMFGMLTMINMCAVLINMLVDLSETVSVVLMVANLLIMSYVCTIKSRYHPVELEKQNFHSIGAAVTMKVLLAAAVLVVLYTVSEISYAYKDGVEWIDPSAWNSMYIMLMIALNVVFIGVYLLLYQMERQVVNRLATLSGKVNSYAKSKKMELDVTEMEYVIANYKENDELGVLGKAFYRMQIDIHHYMRDLTAAIKDKESMEAQLSIAAEIQQGVLPKLESVNDKLSSLGYEVRAGMQAAKVVGGDMYDCFFIDDDHLAIMVADVSGKGIPASLFMMTTQAMIKNNAPLVDPGFILEKSNDTLSRYNERMMFVTMWLGVLEVSTGKMTYANAGHNPPLLMTEEGVQWIKKRSGPVLGIMPETPYKDREIMIPPGSRLLLYTDGLNEAENSNQELFDNERLEAAFAKQGSIDDVLQDVRTFVGDAEQSDDMTYLWLQRR